MSWPRTERLLTRPEGFGLETATPAQRAACRILDGLPVDDLAHDPGVQQLVGGTDAVASLPTRPPREVVFLAAVRCAKTMMACAAAIRMALTVRCDGLKRGEIPRVSIVAPKLDLAMVARNLLSEAMTSSSVLRPLLADEPKAGLVTIRRHDGRVVEIAIVAGRKAGTGLVSRWSAGVIFDEAPRMSGQEDGVVNLDDARSAILGRLLPGAQALYIGSPWAPFGPVYELVQEAWARPTAGLVVLRGQGPVLNPYWWTPERCQELRDTDPEGAYVTDVLAEFAAPEAGLLSVREVEAATRDLPTWLEPVRKARYVAALDPSEGSSSGNAWTLVIVRVESAPESPLRKRLSVALCKQWRGKDVEDIWSEVAAECARYKLYRAHSDQYAASASIALARRYGLTLETTAWTTAEKLDAYNEMATLIRTGWLELAPEPVLRRDLLSIRKRMTQTSQTIVLPTTRDGRHCDYAPSLCLAVSHAEVPGTDSPFLRRQDQQDRMARLGGGVGPGRRPTGRMPRPA